MKAILRAEIENHIPQLNEFISASSQLNSWWDATSIIAKVNQDSLEGHGGTLLESMQNTKQRFVELQHQLKECLLKESFNKASMDMTFKSQNLIDVLARNLFERTADVGFLATDKHIIDYMKSPAPSTRLEIERRLREYVAKYSVYDEILLIRTDGNVVATLNSDNKITHSNDPLITQVLRSDHSYLEFYRPTELVNRVEAAHLYCAKIRENEHIDAPVCGILVMSFKLKDEMGRIFANLSLPNDLSTLALANEQHQVLVSSNTANLSERAKLPSFADALSQNKALLHISKTKGYQGYKGLDWLGVILQPTNYSFRSLQIDQQDSEAQVIWQNSSLVSSELKRINQESVRLSKELRILTLNGKSISHRLKAHSFAPILEKLQELGVEMGQTVSNIVSEINQTALANYRANCEFYSKLAVDIMDRNLYERANDCRWWALTPDFQHLASKTKLASERDHLQSHLKYINDLYTVYTNIFLFDQSGEIVAASAPDNIPEGCSNISKEGWFQQVKVLTNTQQYCVSQFEQNELYGDKPTYIYSAAIRNDKGAFLGGIGVVFDSEPEFAAMLEDCLPLNELGEKTANSSALFVDRRGMVISSTDSKWPVATKMSLPDSVLLLDNGTSTDAIINFDGDNFLVGATCSSGYREYKTTGDYNNDVIALILIKM